MNSRLLIDALVQQTTILLARVSTAAGIRAPLAHVADEVFVSLAREIEAQGVGRKVAADMFGIALRTYQKKMHRLTESATQRERTLWEAVLDFVAERGNIARQDLLDHFASDDEREIIGVLTDLVGSGLIHASGRGVSAVYGLTTDAERQMLAEAADAQSIAAFAWAAIRSTPGLTTRALAQSLRIDLAVAGETVRQLVAEGRVERKTDSEDSPLQASPLVIPVGAEMGWEVAVLDHFRAVVNAIGAKIGRNRMQSQQADVVGGATLSFLLYPGHPQWERVHALLARARSEVNALWEEVEAHNAKNPGDEEKATRVWFYFGQYVEPDQRGGC